MSKTILMMEILSNCSSPHRFTWLDNQGRRNQRTSHLGYPDFIAQQFGCEVGDDFEVILYESEAKNAVPKEVKQYTRPKLDPIPNGEGVGPTESMQYHITLANGVIDPNSRYIVVLMDQSPLANYLRSLVPHLA